MSNRLLHMLVLLPGARRGAGGAGQPAASPRADSSDGPGRTSLTSLPPAGQDPNPAGLGAGTVVSIVLALVLLAVLLVVCGPHAYRKLVKKFRQKKQRQWIGPTGMNQNMSFHRNHTATVRSQVENPTVSPMENEYSQPPRNSHVSAYAALEGALHRVSTQPDNSSDSDYDLHRAQRL